MRNIFHLLMLVIMLGLMACKPALADEDRQEILDDTAPVVDALMDALNEQDYAAFIQQLDEPLAGTISAEDFEELFALIVGRMGNYLNYEVTDVAMVQGLAAVTYKFDFVNETDVNVRLVFHPDGAHLIAGMWFDSPTLRD